MAVPVPLFTFVRNEFLCESLCGQSFFKGIGGELLFSPPDFLFVQKQGIFVQTDTDGAMRVRCRLIRDSSTVISSLE